MTDQLFFIVNPTAGNGRAAEIWREVRAEIKQYGLLYEFDLTQGPLTATGLVRQALRAGSRTIVVVGGDGTINEVVNGFFLGDGLIASDASLAIIPAGGGSDLARSLGVPSGARALGCLLHGRRVQLDVGRASFGDRSGTPAVRYFINNADVGIGARIAAGSQRFKVAGGRIAFFAATLIAVADATPWEGTLEIDGGRREAVCAISVVAALSPYTGGGMHVAPGAKMDDGFFDVVIIGAMDPPQLLLNLPRIYTGTHLSLPQVRHLRARQVRLETEGSPPFQLDGEVAGGGSVEFSLLPRAITVHVGAP